MGAKRSAGEEQEANDRAPVEKPQRSKKERKVVEDAGWQEDNDAGTSTKPRRSKIKTEATVDQKEQAKQQEVAAGQEDQLEEESQGPTAPAKLRRSKRQVKAEALEPGAVVLFWGERRGVIRDSFAPIDEFWVADEQTGELVRENEQIVQFTAADLEPVAPAPKTKHLMTLGEEGHAARSGIVLVIGPEKCVVQALEHFGEPDCSERQNPQQLLAIPCHMCDPEQLQSVAAEGVDENVKSLAEKMREDIHVAVRAFHLKQLIQQVSPYILELEGYYCLAAVQIPHSWEAIEASSSKRERKQLEEVWCQIDLCATAFGEYEDEESPEAAAQRALGENCGIAIGASLWAEDVQLALRRQLGVEFMPVRFLNLAGVAVFVVILPKDTAIGKSTPGVLCFDQRPRGVTESNIGVEKGRRSAGAGATSAGVGGPGCSEADSAAVGVRSAAAREETVAQRMGLEGGDLPPDWERVQSKRTGQVYFYNRKTQESTFEFPEHPLPRGWVKLVSKSNGKPYYWNAGRQKSQYERPRE